MSTSSISSMLNSRLRVSGYASGLDVDSMVQKLMQVETARVDKVKQDKQLLEWQKDDYRNITSLLRGLKDKYFNVTSTSNLLSTSAFNKTAVAVSDASVVQVTGSSTAGVSTHSITVDTLASVGALAGAAGNGTITFDGNTGSKKMSDFTGLTTSDSVLNIDGKDYYFKTDETVSQFMTRINNDSTNKTYRLSYDSTGTKFVLTTKTTGVNTISASGTFLEKAGFSLHPATSSKQADPSNTAMIDFTGLTSGTNVLTIGSKTYAIDSDTETVQQFLDKVNADNGNYTVTIDKTDPANSFFKFTPKSGGTANTNVSGDFLVSAGFTTDPVESLPMGITATGVNASFSIDGIDYTSTTNTFTADGLTYNFLKGGGVTSNVSSTKDVEGMLKNIKEFVDAYNNIISTINTETTEKKYRDYTPLTDDQKSSMSENDIKLWEEKAKSGMLNGDSLVTGLGDRLKKAMYDTIKIPSGNTSLASIGISTTAYYDKGKLTIDETKLRAALTDNPDIVADMFTYEDPTAPAYSPDSSNSLRQEKNGVLFKLDDILNDYIRTSRDSKGKKGLLLEKAGFTNDTTDAKNYMQDLISDKDDLISELTDRLIEKEDAYYTKFTAMETAINNMNSQSSWLSQQLGS